MNKQETWNKLIQLSVVKDEIPEGLWNLIRVNLFGANLDRADLSRVNLYGANLCGVSLAGADLSGSDLNEANLICANLCGANLNGAKLRRTDLGRADLSKADLSGANLCEVNLSGADLSRSNICEANLRGANLCWANLSGANLTGADLSGVNLDKVNLNGATLIDVNFNLSTLRPADLAHPTYPGVSTTVININQCTSPLTKEHGSMMEIISQDDSIQHMKNETYSYELDRLLNELKNTFREHETLRRDEMREATDRMIEAINNGKDKRTIHARWNKIRESIAIGGSGATILQTIGSLLESIPSVL